MFYTRGLFFSWGQKITSKQSWFTAEIHNGCIVISTGAVRCNVHQTEPPVGQIQEKEVQPFPHPSL